MASFLVNFISPTSLTQNEIKIPSYLQNLISQVQSRMGESDTYGLFDLCPEAMDVNYRIYKDKILLPESIQFQKIEKVIKKWAENTKSEIDLHLCYNLEFFYKFILNIRDTYNVKIDEKLINELKLFSDKLKSSFKELTDDNSQKDDQIAMAVSMLKLDLITISMYLYFDDGIKVNKQFLENVNRSLINETHKIINIIGMHTSPGALVQGYDFHLPPFPNAGMNVEILVDDEFSESDLTEWHKLLD